MKPKTSWIIWRRTAAADEVYMLMTSEDRTAGPAYVEYLKDHYHRQLDRGEATQGIKFECEETTKTADQLKFLTGDPFRI